MSTESFEAVKAKVYELLLAKGFKKGYKFSVHDLRDEGEDPQLDLEKSKLWNEIADAYMRENHPDLVEQFKTIKEEALLVREEKERLEQEHKDLQERMKTLSKRTQEVKLKYEAYYNYRRTAGKVWNGFFTELNEKQANSTGNKRHKKH